MHDQLEIFRRGLAEAAKPTCSSDPLISGRGFDETNHNWMVPYPKAYVIPQNGGGQRSNGEANPMVQWLLDHGIQVAKTTANFTGGTKTFPGGSYVVVVEPNPPGLALAAPRAGQGLFHPVTPTD